mgnify:CR=1 FL=1
MDDKRARNLRLVAVLITNKLTHGSVVIAAITSCTNTSNPSGLVTAGLLAKKAAEKGVKLFIPVDSVVADRFAADANTQIVDNDKIPDNWMGLDIGEKSITLFSDVIKNSKTILWNGPMGVFEMEKFQNGTKAIALAIAEATKQGAFSLIGGGDSVAAINQFDLVDQVSYVSTGGGALLEYFEGKELPGIAAVRE